MSEKPENRSAKNPKTLSDAVGAKADRIRKARNNPAPGIWFGLGMMGLIGWSVVVPTLLGAALGFWLDSRGTGTFSWTLMLILAGLILGCLNAWHWVTREHKEMNDEQEEKDE